MGHTSRNPTLTSSGLKPVLRQQNAVSGRQPNLDNKQLNNISFGVDLEKVIDRRLRNWGVDSAEDRRRLTQAIRLAAAKVTNPPPLPSKGQLPLYLERKKYPKLAKLDVIDFLRIVWGKWIKSRVATRMVLREFDPGAERALRYWLQINKSLPDDLYIPTRKQINDELIASGEASRSPRVAYLLAARHARGTPMP